MKEYDWEYYRTPKTTYPIKDNFETTYWYSSGKTVARRVAGNETEYLTDEPVDLNGLVTETCLDKEAYYAARKLYNDETSDLYQEFCDDVFDELGITDNPKRHMLMAIAWDLGHSAGYAEVYGYAYQLVDLIK